jgi:dihydrodipicolinate synthase/N-acetylneuraminate lyase
MTVSSSLRGLIVDLITPLNRGGDIDGTGLGRHLDSVLPHVQGIFLASPYVGEGKNLNPGRREELFEKALVVVRGRVPILFWVSGETIEETGDILQRLRKRIEKRAYNGPVHWIDSPLYYHSNRGLPAYYQDLTSSVKEPFLLYNHPNLIKQLARPLKRTNIRTGILKELARIEGIKGLIFFGSLDRSRNYQKAVRSRPDFKIYDGEEAHFLTHPSLSGVISVGANLAPREWQKITASSLHTSGDQKSYPDHLQQIWKTGEYLGLLMEIYSGQPEVVVKEVLADGEIIDSPACTSEEVPTEDRTRLVKELRARYGFST